MSKSAKIDTHTHIYTYIENYTMRLPFMGVYINNRNLFTYSTEKQENNYVV